jgi:hypothetical protein
MRCLSRDYDKPGPAGKAAMAAQKLAVGSRVSERGAENQ